MKTDIEEILTYCRGLPIDHEPDGWPAIQMRDLTALVDEVDRLRKEAERYHKQRYAVLDSLQAFVDACDSGADVAVAAIAKVKGG
jgi:hypothetical protein